ncbi:hypothetical protein E2C01_071421 [Portunus trituberculatus]|uniref:Uncharacterized protein n=1 Tax=Portunus trituberculatus TaxID=210409 RepID=A0A5B7I868_PORTR|nr:hypothetical protein [Portunus trituberculatus]
MLNRLMVLRRPGSAFPSMAPPPCA